MSNCSKCGHKLRKEDIYCSKCGKKIAEGGFGDGSSSTKMMSLVIIIAVSAAMFVSMLYFQSGNKGTSKSPVVETGSEHNHEQEHNHPVFSEEAIKVASLLMCPCGNCYDNLGGCTCEHKNGGLDSKSVIQKMLEQGKTGDEIVKIFVDQYGPSVLAKSPGSDEALYPNAKKGDTPQ